MDWDTMVLRLYRSISLSLVLLLIFAATGRGERLFGDDVLASGIPTGTTLKRTYCAGQRGIAVSGDTVFVSWDNDSAFVSRSIDGGASFGQPVRVDDAGVNVRDCGMVVGRDGTVYVVWSDWPEGSGPGYNIYFSKSTDGGMTFSPDVRVDDTGSDPVWQIEPAIAVDDSGRIYVAWLDDRPHWSVEVYFSRSLDGGASFEPNMHLPNLEENWNQMGVSIAAAGNGRVCVSCIDNRYYDVVTGCDRFQCVRHSDDAGASFSGPVDVGCGYSTGTSIANAGSLDFFVGWVCSDDYCFVSRSSDGGTTFGPPVQVHTEAANVDVIASVAASSSGWVAVTWEHDLDTIAFAESRDWGASFESMQTLDGPTGREYPTVAMDEENTTYLAWTDYRHEQKGDIYLSKGALDPPAGIEVDPPAGICHHTWLRVAPNPFRTTVSLEAVSGEMVGDLAVYDLQGRLIRRLSAGPGSMEWDGRDDNGARVAPGAYLIVPFSNQTGYAVKLVHCP